MFDTSHIPVAEYIDGDAFENLQIEGVVYVKTDEVRTLLKSTSRVLITHNSDLGIDDDLASLVLENNPNLTAWFGQNIKSRHDKLVPIPIGLERVRWFPSLRKRERLREFAERSLEPPSKLCLANFSVSTNPGERRACLKAASSFATLQAPDTVRQDTADTYARYLATILEHKFVLCPNGNGVDTHRLWETLYLGRIPVVTRSLVAEAFAGLPMVILDSWADLSSSRLLSYWDDFRKNQIPCDHLLMSYWRDRIKSAARGKSRSG